MKKFKVGDKVVRTGKDYKDIKKGDIYVVREVSRNADRWSFGINLEGYYNKNGEFEYDGNSFQLYEENNMNDNENKIKVGDTVRLKSGIICCGLNHMTQYLVERVRCKSVALEGKDGAYDESIFIKVKSNPELIGEILTPLQASEAIINKQKLQVFDTDMNKWFGFHSDLRNITLEDLKHIKLRHKPKTIIINGVEVAAPVELPRYSVGYTPSLCHREVQTACAGKGRIMWATKEDAQKALDAMLISFKGD